jgi:Porin subfamily
VAAVCNPDYNASQLGGIIRRTPVKNLTFSAHLTYTHLDQKMAGSETWSRAAGRRHDAGLTASFRLK